VVKRTVDVVGAIITLFLALPVMVVVALVVYAAMGRPILFVQRRPGLLAATALSVVRRTGITQNGQATVERFRGNDYEYDAPQVASGG